MSQETHILTTGDKIEDATSDTGAETARVTLKGKGASGEDLVFESNNADMVKQATKCKEMKLKSADVWVQVKYTGTAMDELSYGVTF